MEVITISNQKGGVGKTTTAHTLAIGLHKRNYKVLLIDSDPQCNLTYSLNEMNKEKTLYNVYNGEDIKNCIIPTNQGVHLLSGDLKLLNADKQYIDIGKEYILKKAVEEVKQYYDYIIIDTPPTLGILTINALTCSDSVIIPMQADIFSIQGLSQLKRQIDAVTEYTNPKLEVKGVLLIKYHNRTILNRKLYDTIKTATQQIDIPLFKTTIREGIAVRESQTKQSNIFDYDPKGKVTKDYIDFINEFLKIR